jgi:hypothetical protein
MVYELIKPEIELKFTSHIPDIYKIYHMLILMQMQLTHLYIFAMKVMLGHVERITPCPHDSVIQIRFELNSVECV